MYVYRLAYIHLHHCHKEDRVFIHDRIVRQVCLSRHMLIYSMRLIRIILKREIKSKGMVMVGYEHDPYHYIISLIPLKEQVAMGTHEWYHLVAGFC